MVENTQDDLSMEDILSSIRNILMEDNATQQTDTQEAVSIPVVEKFDEPTPVEVAPEDILNLSSSMIIATPEPQIMDEMEEVISFPDIELNDDDIDFIDGLADFNRTSIVQPVEDVQPDVDITNLFSEEDPTDASVMADVAADEQAYSDTIEEASFEVADVSDVASVPFNEDNNAEPIFSPEEDNLSIDYNLELEDTSIENEMVNLGIDEVSEEDSFNALIDDSTLDEILGLHAQVESEKAEELVKEEPKEELLKEEAVDVSANIINNFARMFADKQETKPQINPILNDAKHSPSLVCDNIALGNGSVTLEDIVKDSVRAVVEKNLQSINNIATQEINRQTKVWLDNNLASTVEAIVKQEIERVMVKVGR